LVFDRSVARQKNDGHLRGLRALFHLAHESIPVELRETGVGDDEIRRLMLERFERSLPVVRARHAVAGFAQADLENAQAPQIGVDEEELFLRQEGFRKGFAFRNPTSTFPCQPPPPPSSTAPSTPASLPESGICAPESPSVHTPALQTRPVLQSEER